MVELDNIAARDPVLTVKAEIIRIDGAAICEWKRFHEISAEVFGFPDFYGNNGGPSHRFANVEVFASAEADVAD